MNPTFRRVLIIAAVAISVGSILFDAYFGLAFARSANPDRSLILLPLVFCGLPLTAFGHIVGVMLMHFVSGMWLYGWLVVVCFFVQWQHVAWRLFRAGTATD